ncbi:defective in cullin neddylation protein [Perilla frutescens var. frutescens]|nr:defective in cullin neddylation protein [Perilla frutescens var. frutescens]
MVSVLFLQFGFFVDVTDYCSNSTEALESPAPYASYISSEHCNRYIIRNLSCFRSVSVLNKLGRGQHDKVQQFMSITGAR